MIDYKIIVNEKFIHTNKHGCKTNVSFAHVKRGGEWRTMHSFGAGDALVMAVDDLLNNKHNMISDHPTNSHGFYIWLNKARNEGSYNRA